MGIPYVGPAPTNAKDLATKGYSDGYAGINFQTGTSYTPTADDPGKLVSLFNASPITLTLPPASGVDIPVGRTIDFVQLGAGAVTIVAGSSVTIYSTPSLVLRAQYSTITAIKLDVNLWLVVGDLA